MKNNSMTLTIANMVEVTSYSVWVKNVNLESIIAHAYDVKNGYESKKFMARVTIKIEDLSEPLRIERPEEHAEEAQA